MPDQLPAITNDFQQLLEHHRRDPDDETVYRMMRDTQARMEQAWLQKLLDAGT